MKFIPLLTASAIAVSVLSACGGGSDSVTLKDPVIGQNGAVTTATADASITENCDIASFATKMLAEVNAARAAGHSCGNTAYAAAPAIGWNEFLTQAAAQQTVDMAASNTLSSTGADGSTFLERLDTTGYEYYAAGEALAVGQSTPAKVVAAVLSNATDCKKLMSQSIKEMGAACSKATSGRPYWSLTVGANIPFEQ